MKERESSSCISLAHKRMKQRNEKEILSLLADRHKKGEFSDLQLVLQRGWSKKRKMSKPDLPRRPIPIKPGNVKATEAPKAKARSAKAETTTKAKGIDEAADAVVKSFTKHTQGVEKGEKLFTQIILSYSLWWPTGLLFLSLCWAEILSEILCTG